MNKIVSTLHTATHLVPGVPDHTDKASAQQPRGTNSSPRPHTNSSHMRSPRVHGPNRHHQAPPRVLVKWQNWIGRLVGHDSRR